jgi:hypothetical protein
MDDDYRECSVCSALLTDDEVWADSSGSVVYTTSSLDLDEDLQIGALNGVLCEHCYALQETTEFSGSYDFSDADELDPWMTSMLRRGSVDGVR